MHNSGGTIDLRGKAIGIGLLGLAALVPELAPAVANAGQIPPSGWDLKANKKYAMPDPYAGLSNGIRVATGDLDGDGHADIVVGNGDGVDNIWHTIKYQPATDSFVLNGSTSADTPQTHQQGVRVAVGDLDGDGIRDVVVGAGSGGSSAVHINFTKIEMKYQETYSYPQARGVYVAAGDVNGDGLADLVTGPSKGDDTSGVAQSPVVQVFDYAGSTNSISPIGSFSPFAGTAYSGGVRVALGDVNGDGTPDIISSPDQATDGTIWVHSVSKASPLLFNAVSSFTAGSSGSPNGVFVAAGDVNGDGRADIITGAGPGGLPEVKVYSFNTATSSWSVIDDFMAGDPSFTGGVEVAAGDFNGDGFADIITAPATAVPEPASIAMLTVASGALLMRRRRVATQLRANTG